MQILRKVKTWVPYGYGAREVERSIGLCQCGQEVELFSFTNTCKCGRDYNMSGQRLAPRSQWGEETGETASEILNAGHHVM